MGADGFELLRHEDYLLKKTGASILPPPEESRNPGSPETIKQNYQSLQNVLEEAYRQAAQGKGHERHAKGEPFEEQKICEITRRLIGSPVQSLLYQAVKKIYETTRTDPIPELLGAINYISAAVIILRELEQEKERQQERNASITMSRKDFQEALLKG